MKCRETFLVIPTFVFTKCAFIAVQLTLETCLNPELFKSTILTPTFSYEAEAEVAVSILPPVAGARSGGSSRPRWQAQAELPGSLAELSSSLYEARGRQKGCLSNPPFLQLTRASSRQADK